MMVAVGDPASRVQLCRGLIACDDPAEIRVLGDQLPWGLHEWKQEAGSQIRVLPLLHRQPMALKSG